MPNGSNGYKKLFEEDYVSPESNNIHLASIEDARNELMRQIGATEHDFRDGYGYTVNFIDKALNCHDFWRKTYFIQDSPDIPLEYKDISVKGNLGIVLESLFGKKQDNSSYADIPFGNIRNGEGLELKTPFNNFIKLFSMVPYRGELNGELITDVNKTFQKEILNLLNNSEDYWDNLKDVSKTVNRDNDKRYLYTRKTFANIVNDNTKNIKDINNLCITTNFYKSFSKDNPSYGTLEKAATLKLFFAEDNAVNKIYNTKFDAEIQNRIDAKLSHILFVNVFINKESGIFRYSPYFLGSKSKLSIDKEEGRKKILLNFCELIQEGKILVRQTLGKKGFTITFSINTDIDSSLSKLWGINLLSQENNLVKITDFIIDNNIKLNTDNNNIEKQ